MPVYNPSKPQSQIYYVDARRLHLYIIITSLRLRLLTQKSFYLDEAAADPTKGYFYDVDL